MRVRVAERGSRTGAIAGNSHDAGGSFVKAVMGEAERVLHAVRGEERSDSLQIAAAKNQCDDGLRGDGIKPRRGRIVKDYVGAVHESARNRDAAAHTAG